MYRRLARMIASAIAAGAIAFGTAVATAFANASTINDATCWIIIGAVVAAVGKDVQSGLSEPPGKPE